MALALPVLCAFTCGHVQQPGNYVYAVDQLQQDACGLIANPAQAASGTLQVIGSDLRIDNFLAVGNQLQLVGAFLSQEESFTLDGTDANVSVLVGGQTCPVDMLSLHVDAVTDDASHFHGAARVTTQSLAHPLCQCQTWFTYKASLQ